MIKRYKKKDPFKKRETEKYDFPVPSREFILDFLKEHKKPVRFDQFCTAFALSKPAVKEGFRFRLKAMLRDGQLHQNRRGAYAIVKDLKLLSGRVIGHRDGYGFVVTDEAGPDVFLSERDMRSLFNDDRVLVQVVKTKKGNRLEGRLIEVLQRNTSTLVGVFHRDGGINIVRPDSKHIPLDVIIPHEECSNANENDIVEVEIISQPTKRHAPVGRISRVIGDKLTPGLEIEMSAINNKLPIAWPDEVLDQVESIPNAVLEEEIKQRRDCRHMDFVTIDGVDAKDFDDAVFCKPSSNGGWTLWVAIADVAHYVKVDSPLDQEAFNRGNSVYFPGRVVPMLPEKLSNGLCSLMPNVDRLAMVCEMQFSASGEFQSQSIYSAVIHSKRRWTYAEVGEILAKEFNDDTPDYICHLYRLYQLLEVQRKKRGALEFESTETRISFNDQGKIDSIIPIQRNEAHKLIEECMLAANVAVATYIESKAIESIYRVHEAPEPSKINQLRDYLKLFSLDLSGGDEPNTKDFSLLLSKIKERADAPLLQRVILRAQKQALYHAENSGHFGLGYDGYTHFTSPIRRYADLIVHRALKHLASSNDADHYDYSKSVIVSIADHCSATERRADLATREAEDRLKCDFMRDKVGRVYDGTVVEVTQFGVFVELDTYYVQGLIHISALEGDYYYYDELHHALIGKHSGRSYKLTDRLTVLVASVNVETRKIDFDLAPS